MDLGRVLGVKRVLHCSTAAVYEPSPDPLREEQAGGALNHYGAAKLAMERAIGEDVAAHPDGPTQCILRIANFAGADSLFAGLDRGDGPITLDQFDDGQGPMRSYLTPSGLGQAIEALLQCPRAALPDVLNVAAPGAVAMADLVRAAGREVAWKPAPQGAAPRVELDVARLRAICSECRPQSARDIVADVARARGEAKGST